MKSVASFSAARKAPFSFGLSRRNLAVVAITLQASGSSNLWVLVRMRRMLGFFICWYWNGADEKLAATSLGPPSMAAVASGWAIDTVRWSRASNLAAPNSFAAAICRMIACIDTLTAGIAILWLSLK